MGFSEWFDRNVVSNPKVFDSLQSIGQYAEKGLVKAGEAVGSALGKAAGAVGGGPLGSLLGGELGKASGKVAGEMGVKGLHDIAKDVAHGLAEPPATSVGSTFTGPSVDQQTASSVSGTGNRTESAPTDHDLGGYATAKKDAGARDEQNPETHQTEQNRPEARESPDNPLRDMAEGLNESPGNPLRDMSEGLEESPSNPLGDISEGLGHTDAADEPRDPLGSEREYEYTPKETAEKSDTEVIEHSNGQPADYSSYPGMIIDAPVVSSGDAKGSDLSLPPEVIERSGGQPADYSFYPGMIIDAPVGSSGNAKGSDLSFSPEVVGSKAEMAHNADAHINTVGKASLNYEAESTLAKIAAGLTDGQSNGGQKADDLVNTAGKASFSQEGSSSLAKIDANDMATHLTVGPKGAAPDETTTYHAERFLGNQASLQKPSIESKVHDAVAMQGHTANKVPANAPVVHGVHGKLGYKADAHINTAGKAGDTAHPGGSHDAGGSLANFAAGFDNGHSSAGHKADAHINTAGKAAETVHSGGGHDAGGSLAKISAGLDSGHNSAGHKVDAHINTAGKAAETAHSGGGHDAGGSLAKISAGLNGDHGGHTGAIHGATAHAPPAHH